MFQGEAPLDTEITQSLQNELVSGESILWCGRPLRRILFHRSDWLMIPFSFLWGGMTLSFVWKGVDLRNDLSHFEFTSIIPFAFVILGQYMIWGRFIYDAWKKTRVCYGVTNRRVLVLVRGRSRKTIERPLRSLDSLDLTIRADGAGTISFSDPLVGSGMHFRGQRQSFGLLLESLNFYDIPDARRVYELIRDLRDQAARTSS